MKSLHFFTGKDGEVVAASKPVSDWEGEILKLDTIAARRRPVSVSGRRFARVIDLILEIESGEPPKDLAAHPVMYESPPCQHFSAPAGKAVRK